MKLRDMHERRAVIVAEMRSITDKPAGNGRDLSDEQAQKFDTLKGELEGIEKNIARQALIDAAERRMQGEPIGESDTRFAEACRDFSLRAAIAGAAGLSVEWGRERELSAELARRAGRPFQGIAVPMSVFHQRIEKRVVTGAGEGSNLIGTDLRGDQFIDALHAALVTRRLGARVLSGLVGDIDLPKIAASSSAAWIADNSALVAADPDLSKVNLTPKTVGMLTEFSRRTLLQSSPDIEQILRSDFAQTLAAAVDLGALKGTGTTQPQGIIGAAGVTEIAVVGEPTWTEILEFIAEVEVDNALMGSLGWAMAPRVKKKLRSTAKVASTDSVMLMESERELAGYPAFATANLAGSGGSPSNGELIFGNWADLILGYWSELDLLVNPFESTAYSRGGVQIRGLISMDSAMRRAESFVYSNDVATS